MARQFSIDPFFNSGTVYCIAPNLWQQLCKPYETALKRLKILNGSQSLNEDRFHEVLANQTNELPQAFLSMLSLVCDLSESGEHIILLQEVRIAGLDVPAEASTGDLAALLVIHCPQRAEELRVELQPSRRRKVRCYYAMGRSIPQMSRVSDEIVKELESAIAKEGERKGRTGAVKIYQPNVQRGFRLIVTRGDVLHRAPVINVQTEASESMAFHPVNQDTLTYDPRYGELKMRVSKPSDLIPYLQHIGHHVFGDAAQFPPQEEIRYFSLKPILGDQKKCMNCLDIPGIKRVVATKFRWKLPGFDEYPFEYSAPIGLEQDGRPLQQIMHAGSTASGLDVMFEMDGNRERRIRIEMPNTIVFFDDDDADAIFSWLRARGFINSAEEALNGANMRLRDAG